MLSVSMPDGWCHPMCMLCAGGPATPHRRHLHCLPPGLCHAPAQPCSRRCALRASQKHSSTRHSLLLAVSSWPLVLGRCCLWIRRDCTRLQGLQGTSCTCHTCLGNLRSPSAAVPAAACSRVGTARPCPAPALQAAITHACHTVLAGCVMFRQPESHGHVVQGCRGPRCT